MSRSAGALRALLASRERVAVCLDVDGTLAPVAASPGGARVPAGTRRALRRIRAHDIATLIVVSGRRAVEARNLVATPVDWTIGNHGFELARGGAPARPFGSWRGSSSVRCAAERIAEAIEGLRGVSLEDKGWTLAVHYRRGGTRAAPLVWRRVRTAVRGLDVQLLGGKQYVDVRPAGGWDKGKAVKRLLAGIYGSRWLDQVAVLYAGDDVTDEHVFTQLPAAALTVKVGTGPTQARFRTRSPETLERWLGFVAGELP